METLLTLLAFDLRRNNTRFTEETVSMLFLKVLPLLFEKAIQSSLVSVINLIHATVEWLPVCRADKVVTWLGSNHSFLLEPTKRLAILVRILGGSPKGKLCVLSILDHFLVDFIGQPYEGDEGFIEAVEARLRDTDLKSGASLIQLSRLLELASLRLLNTCIEDLDEPRLVMFKKSLTLARDSIMPQPRKSIIRILDCYAKMILHVETHLRSKGKSMSRIDNFYTKTKK